MRRLMVAPYRESGIGAADRTRSRRRGSPRRRRVDAGKLAYFLTGARFIAVVAGAAGMFSFATASGSIPASTASRPT